MLSFKLMGSRAARTNESRKGGNEMNDNGSLQAIPEELLESIAGGVLTDDDREAIRRGAQISKDNGWSSETAYGVYAAAIVARGTSDDLEDLGEIKSIIKQVYGE